MKRLWSHLFRKEEGIALLIVMAFMAVAVPVMTTTVSLAGTLSKDSRVKTSILKEQYSAQGCTQRATYRLFNEEGYADSLVLGEPNNFEFEGCSITVTKVSASEASEVAYADLVLTLDNSWSISDLGSPSELDRLQQAANTIVDRFSLSDTEGRVRIGVSRFHESTFPVVSMTDVDDHGVSEPLHDGINGISWCFFCLYETNIVAGLNGAAAQYSTGLGDRVDPPFDVPNLLVFITDGNDNQGNTLTDIENASLATGAEVFAIGVGSDVSVATLNAIATDPDATHVFTTDDFDELLTIIDNIVAAVYGAAGVGTLFTIEAVSPGGIVSVIQILIPPA